MYIIYLGLCEQVDQYKQPPYECVLYELLGTQGVKWIAG